GRAGCSWARRGWRRASRPPAGRRSRRLGLLRLRLRLRLRVGCGLGCRVGVGLLFHVGQAGVLAGGDGAAPLVVGGGLGAGVLVVGFGRDRLVGARALARFGGRHGGFASYGFGVPSSLKYRPAMVGQLAWVSESRSASVTAAWSMVPSPWST